MDYKELLRETLLNNGYGIYSSLLDIYGKQLEFLKTPALFRKWLAKELKVPIEKINLNSLNSAVKRQRKKNKQSQQQPPRPASSQPHNGANQTGKFQFSIPASDDEKASRIKEY